MTSLSPLRIIQLTDMHLFADEHQQLLGVPTTESFQTVLGQVVRLQAPPDLLLLTGDLSQDGKPESYELLQRMLAPLNISAYWLPGNHDRLPAMEQTLTGGVLSAQKSFQAGGWHFLLLNSQLEGCVHGYLSSDTLDWLDHQLQMVGAMPTVIGLHHPPFLVGSDWLDSSTLQNPDDLFAVLDRHPQVKLVLFGHVHQEFSLSRRGVQFLGSPSTCIQFEPQSSAFSLDRASPGFRILHLYPDESWWTTVERVSYRSTVDLAATGY